jgi:hypothetical protein
MEEQKSIIQNECSAPLAVGTDWLIRHGFETTQAPNGRVCRDEVIMGKWVQLDKDAKVLVSAEGKLNEGRSLWIMRIVVSDDMALAHCVTQLSELLVYWYDNPADASGMLSTVLWKFIELLPSLRAIRHEYEQRVSDTLSDEADAMMATDKEAK